MQASSLFLLAFLLACRGPETQSGESAEPSSGSGASSGERVSQPAQDSGRVLNRANPSERAQTREPELEIIATGLDVPWGMDLLPDGQLLVAERSGRITRIDPSTGKQTELARRPALDQGEGGLLGLVLDPEFGGSGSGAGSGGAGSGAGSGSGGAGSGAGSGGGSGGSGGVGSGSGAGSGGNKSSPYPYLYLYETTAEGNQIVRMRLEGDALREDRVLLTGIPKARYHNGGVIRFGPDGYLYAGTGDGREPFSAQDPNSLGGKVLRMTRDGEAVGGAGVGNGSAPGGRNGSGNGSAPGGRNGSGSGSAPGGTSGNGSAPGGTSGEAAASSPASPASLVYSLGHRNIQGLAWDADGNLYATEHGPSGEINGWCCHDEVNRIVQGGNYGWPHVIGDQTRGGCIQPLAHSGEDTWAPGGCGVLSGSGWEQLEGHLITAGLRGQHLRLFDLKTGKTSAIWFQDRLGRLRNVLVGPDGSVYFCSSNRDGRGRPQDGDDKIYRVKPAG